MPDARSQSPCDFLQQQLGILPIADELRDYQTWWQTTGRELSEAIDRAGTPWLRTHDRSGRHCDEILLGPGYRQLINEGYRRGVIWRVFEEKSLLSSYLLGYLTSFNDPGLYCPYTVSLGTAVSLFKYGNVTLRRQFLEPMLRRDDQVWQGATWMTEIKGGSDLGANVETRAEQIGRSWYLSGEKYFTSNVGAELAVVAARPVSAPAGVRGLALFLVPRRRRDGELNYQVVRIKDKIATRSVPTGECRFERSEAHLLGRTDQGIYQILEVLNISRIANAIGCIALGQRALSEAVQFAGQHRAFGKAVAKHPLLARQIKERKLELEQAFALTWEAVRLLDRVWRQKPPYSDDYHLFRLLAHLAKYWTAEFAVQTAKWGMEVHGGRGTLTEYPVERWLREAMIMAIWEGTPHRQILDGIEVMQRKKVHTQLLNIFAAHVSKSELTAWHQRIDNYLQQSQTKIEEDGEAFFSNLAQFTARGLLQKNLKSRHPEH
ncbi:MAG: acyl-CoA dehydrogenase family protein [Desulfuromonadales bacterium]